MFEHTLSTSNWSSRPHSRKEYDVLAASLLTPCEMGPLAPAGQASAGVKRVTSLRPVIQYPNVLWAAPWSAVPRACRVALVGPTSVAGSVDP